MLQTKQINDKAELRKRNKENDEGNPKNLTGGS